MNIQHYRSFGLSVLSLTMAAILSAACQREVRSFSQVHIFGGTPVLNGEWASAVALEKNGRLACSGVAVHPSLVLTAAHCIAHKSLDDLRIHVGNGTDEGAIVGTSLVRKAVFSPRYTTWAYEDTNDLAYLVLETPLELPAHAYPKLLTTAESVADVLTPDQVFHVVGFGRRDGHPGGSKWVVETKLKRKTSKEIYLGGEGRDSCEGDSGGPVYVGTGDNEWQLLALTVGGSECGHGGRYNLLHTELCWVQQDSGIDLGIDACIQE